MIVEDDVDLRTALGTSLRRHGLASFGVGSGSEALGAMERTVFDAVLLDLNLPGIHGCRLLRRIQCLENAPPAVILSGADQNAMVRAGVNGARVVLQKPTRPSEVAEALSRVISGGGR